MQLWAVGLALLLVLLPGGGGALPLLDLAEPVVVPGTAVDVTVVGRPGDHWSPVVATPTVPTSSQPSGTSSGTTAAPSPATA